MTPLPNDCARCVTDGCPRASTCRRTVPAPPDAYRTTFSAYPGGEDCPDYWPEEQR